MQPEYRLLVVEDDLDVLALTCELLQTTRFQVTAASELGQAVRSLTHGAFELVLADLYLSSSSREAAWRDIEHLRALAGITPVGVVTGAPVTRDDIIRPGIAFILQKPVSVQDLLDTISRAIALPSVPTHRQAIVRAYFASIESSSWDWLASLCSPDVTYYVPPGDPRFSQVVRGRAEFRRFAIETFRDFPEPRFAVTSLRPLPEGVLVRYEGSWRTPDGRREVLPGAVLFRFAGQEIAEIGVRLELTGLIA